MSSELFVRIAPAVPLSPSKRQTYDYRFSALPAQTLELYQRVIIPFGHRRVGGVILDTFSPQKNRALKPIQKIVPTALTKNQFTFGSWIASTAQGGLGYSLRLFFPPEARSIATAKNDGSSRLKARALSPLSRSIAAALTKDSVMYIEPHFTARHQIVRGVVEQVASRGQQVLLLVPDRWLLETWAPYIPTIHAAMRPSYRSWLWHSVKDRQVAALAGTQKAAFLPFQDLGLIVIEEEYSPWHKLWDQYPRLDNITLAKQLARIHACPILYATSLPSVRLARMIEERATPVFQKQPPSLPHVRIVYGRKSKSVPSAILPVDSLRLIRGWMQRKKRVALLYNRTEEPSGIMQLSRELHKSLSSVTIFRFDRTSRPYPNDVLQRIKSSHMVLATNSILSLADREERLFDEVLWLFPEQALFHPDYQTRENTYLTFFRLERLLARKRPITVITRSLALTRYFPKKSTDFFKEELKLRRRLFYPPYSDIMKLTVETKGKRTAWQQGETIRHRIDELSARSPIARVVVRGPYRSFGERHKPAAVHLLMRGELDTLRELCQSLAGVQVEHNPNSFFK